MSAMQRTKGATGERELMHLLSDELGATVQRRIANHHGASDLIGVDGWSIEVKRHAQFTHADLARHWKQAVFQSRTYGAIPMLAYRADRAQWRCVYPLSVHLTAQCADYWTDYDWIADVTPKAWAAVVREVTPK